MARAGADRPLARAFEPEDHFFADQRRGHDDEHLVEAGVVAPEEQGPPLSAGDVLDPEGIRAADAARLARDRDRQDRRRAERR